MRTDPDTSPVFHFTVFGGPELRVREEETRLSPLQGAFLGLVYGRASESISREEVLSIFWPEDDPAPARRRLNQLLYSMKKRFGPPPPFDVLGETIRRCPDRTTSDFQDFQSALEEGRLPDCLRYLEAGFMRQAEGTFTMEFTNWIQGRDRDLRRVLRGRARKRLTLTEEQANWKEAGVAAEVLLRLDPTNEETFRLFLRTRVRAGGFLDLEAAVRGFSGRVEEASGSPWSPSDETQGLLERIQLESETSISTWVPEAGPATPDPPLFGRENELNLLRRTVAATPHRALRGILIVGEAGIGKTRLIKESVSGLGVEGHQVFSAGTAELGKLIPLSPLIEAFSGPRAGEALSSLEEPWRAVLYGVMPRHFSGPGPIPQAPQIQPGSVPHRLFEAFHQLLLSLVDEGPLVLVMEDIQWADETTLAVLDFLIRRWDQGRLQILFSVRSEEINRNSPLKSFLETVRVHDDFLEIPLKDLSTVASTTLIRELASRPLLEDEVAYLQALAGGNPFFLIELTLEYLAGRVDQRAHPAEVLSIPLSIRQVLQRRLSHLSPDADEILRALSVHVRNLGIQELPDLIGIPLQKCITGLDQLHQFRLVKARGLTVGIGHELIRQTVYQELNSSRRAWLHERVARHLQSSSDPPGADELAVHFHMAGVADEARKFAKNAADHAEESGAVAEAIRFLQIAREHSEDPEEVAVLIGRMGHLHYLHQNLEEAAPLLEIASQRFRRQGKPAKALEPELERVDALGKTDLLPLRECLEELTRIKEEAKELEEWGTYMRALDVEIHVLDHSGDLEGVYRVMGEAGQAVNKGEAEAQCRARAVLALNLYFGDPASGLLAAREAVEIAMRTDKRDLQLHALNRLIVVLLYQGMLLSTEGAEAFRLAEERLASSGDLMLKFFIHLNKAVWHLEAGELDSAEEAFPIAEAVLRGTHADGALTLLLLNRAELELAQDDPSSAYHTYTRAGKLIGRSSPRFFRTVHAAGLGLCALQDGNLSEAKRFEKEIADLPTHWTYDPSVVALFKSEMFRMRGDPRKAADFLAQVGEDIRSRFVTTWVKLGIQRIRVLRRFSEPDAHRVAEEILSVAGNLGLVIRSRTLEGLLSMIGPN